MRTSKFILIVSFLMISIFVFSAVRDIDTINETGIFKSPELISEVFPNLIKLIDIKNNVGQLKNHYFLNQSEVIISDFCFYDINGDDSDDILFYTRDNQGSLKINAVEFNCKVIFGFPKVLPSNISGVTGKPEIGDLNNDGEYEFIIFTDNGSYNIYNNDMNLLQENIISTKPVYGLINEEGADNQIIVTTVNNLGKTILVINNFMNNISYFDIDNFNAPNTILYKDIDNDGEKEIILGDGEKCKAFTFQFSTLELEPEPETAFPTNFIFSKLNIIKITDNNCYIGLSKDNKVNVIDISGVLLFSGDILKIFGLTDFSIYNFPETSPENDELIFTYRDLIAYYSFDNGFEYHELSKFNNKLYNNFGDIDLEIISPNYPIVETVSGFDIDITIDVFNPGNKQMYYKTFIYQENDEMIPFEPTNKLTGSQYLGEILGNKSNYKISTFNTAFIEDLNGICDIRVKVVDTEGRTANVDKEILKTKIDENYVLNNLSTVPSHSYSNEINLFGTRSENIQQLFFLHNGNYKKVNKDIELINKMISNDLYDFETEFNETNKQISICYVVKNNNLKEIRFKRILFFPIETELDQTIYTTENNIKEIKMKKFNNEILIVLKLLDNSDDRFKILTFYSNDNSNSFNSIILPLNFSGLAFMNFQLDSIGNIHLVWREQSGFYFDTYYSKYSKTLGEIIPPLKINTVTDISINNPNIQICEDDSVHILYSALDENKGSGGPNDPLKMKIMYSSQENNTFVEPIKILNYFNL
ncbi:hypothetical protein KAU11_10945, partial [Candidatus Babeliales bacterium]|nr:hypothetical protein [Candidatus Babeliales bacterium]